MGFEATLFLDRHQPIDANLTCTLCLGVYCKPSVACANGHVYCSDCLSRAKREAQRRSLQHPGTNAHSACCPDCRGVLLDSPPLVRPTQNMIAAMTMRCENGAAESSDDDDGKKRDGGEEKQPAPPKRRRTRSNAAEVDAEEATAAATNGEKKDDGEEEQSCKWQGSPSEYADHIKACPFGKVECPCRPYRCKEVIFRKDLEQHKMYECKYREVECPDCKTMVKHCSLNGHLRRSCPEGDIKCSFCFMEMKRKDLGRRGQREAFSEDETHLSGHYRICPKLPLRCEFYDLGCQAELPREGLSDHHACYARYHASLVSKEIESARDWQNIDITWSVEDDRLQGLDRLVFKSPTTTTHACGHSCYLKLTLETQRIFVELCSSSTNRRSDVTIRNVSLWMDYDDDQNYGKAHAKKVESNGRKLVLGKHSEREYFGERSPFVYVDESSDGEECSANGGDGEEIEVTRQTIQELRYDAIPIHASFQVKRTESFNWYTDSSVHS